MERYRDRAEVREVVLGLGLFPAFEAGWLDPDLMPDPDSRLLAAAMRDALNFTKTFVDLFRAAMMLPDLVEEIRMLGMQWNGVHV